MELLLGLLSGVMCLCLCRALRPLAIPIVADEEVAACLLSPLSLRSSGTHVTEGPAATGLQQAVRQSPRNSLLAHGNGPSRSSAHDDGAAPSGAGGVGSGRNLTPIPLRHPGHMTTVQLRESLIIEGVAFSESDGKQALMAKLIAARSAKAGGATDGAYAAQFKPGAPPTMPPVTPATSKVAREAVTERTPDLFLWRARARAQVERLAEAAVAAEGQAVKEVMLASREARAAAEVRAAAEFAQAELEARTSEAESEAQGRNHQLTQAVADRRSWILKAHDARSLPADGMSNQTTADAPPACTWRVEPDARVDLARRTSAELRAAMEAVVQAPESLQVELRAAMVAVDEARAAAAAAKARYEALVAEEAEKAAQPGKEEEARLAAGAMADEALAAAEAQAADEVARADASLAALRERSPRTPVVRVDLYSKAEVESRGGQQRRSASSVAKSATLEEASRVEKELRAAATSVVREAAKKRLAMAAEAWAAAESQATSELQVAVGAEARAAVAAAWGRRQRAVGGQCNGGRPQRAAKVDVDEARAAAAAAKARYEALVAEEAEKRREHDAHTRRTTAAAWAAVVPQEVEAATAPQAAAAVQAREQAQAISARHAQYWSGTQRHGPAPWPAPASTHAPSDSPVEPPSQFFSTSEPATASDSHNDSLDGGASNPSRRQRMFERSHAAAQYLRGSGGGTSPAGGRGGALRGPRSSRPWR